MVWEKNISELAQGYKTVTCNMLFDVKMGKNFRRKARFVADGHTTNNPEVIPYSSVVSRDSVHITLTIAARNELYVLA